MKKEIEANTTLSHYRIVSKIGAGGMGEVYLAQDVKLNRKVALKILPNELAADQDRMRRFVQEAQSAAALNHPNIAHIYEIGEEEGTNFIAMEFVDGETLRDKIHREQTELTKLLRYLQHAAEGLARAHEEHIVHRDLKPDNIMITRDDHAKILDFGLAKLIESQHVAASDSSEVATAVMPQRSKPGTVMGTVGYMSPEQAKGKTKDIDQRSDIFSFGCILFEAATRRKPFEGTDAIESLNKIIRESAPSIVGINPASPPDLKRIVDRCLEKDPDERYQSIKEVAIELKKLRRELQGAGIDTTVTPPTRSETTGTTGGEDTRGQSFKQTTDTSALSSRVSSAEYLVTGIKQHKFAAAVTFIVLVSGITAVALFVRGRNASAAINSIAVLPFVNESGQAEAEYLSDGMTESLITSLSQIPNLKVKARSSVFRYKGKETDPKTVGKDLGVQAILNGRIAQIGHQLTLRLELVDVQTENILWSQQYNRNQADLVSLQSDIAKELSTHLKAKLSGAEESKVTRTATADPEAYQAYLKGRYYWNRRTRENIRKAIEQFKAATDRDPNYALAYAGLADCYVVLNFYAGTPTSETIPQAKTYAERAIAIDDQLAEPHASLGQVNKLSWRWADAEREYQRALELNPNYATAYHWYSLLLKALGRFDEAAVIIKRAHEIDPLSSVISVNLAESYQTQNNQNASIETCLKIIELDPNYADAYDTLGQSYLKQGRNAEAIANLEKSVELSRAGTYLGALGNGYAVTGKRAEAIAIAKELEENYARKEANGRHVAAVYAGLGEKDKAFEWLEKDFQTKGDLTFFRWEIPYESLRDDPRFKDLLRRMGLPQ